MACNFDWKKMQVLRSLQLCSKDERNFSMNVADKMEILEITWNRSCIAVLPG